MADRAPGLAGIVSGMPGRSLSSYNRNGLSSGLGGLMDALDAAGYGGVTVNSGYRSPTRNASAGGAKRSQHLSGNAIDIDTSRMSQAEKAGLMSAAAKAGAKGFGLYSTGNSLHLDMRSTPTVWGINGSYRGVPLSSLPAWQQEAIGPAFGKVARAPLAPLPATVPVADVRRRAPTPTAFAENVGVPTARPDMSTGLGLPSIPAAPAPGGFFGGDGLGNKALGLAGPAGAIAGGILGGNSFKNRTIGAAVGGLLGTAVAGPVGGLLGGLVGRGLGNASYGTPSNAASAALNAGWDGFSGMTDAQTNAARSAPSGGGGSSGWGGGGGLLGGLGGLLGGIFGGGTASSSAGKGTTGRTGDGGWGNSPNVSKGGGGVSDGGKKK